MQLKEKQNPNGSIPHNDKNESIFATSIFLILENRKSPQKDKALKWLKKQKNKKWIFHDKLGIDFLALSAIFKNDPDFIDGEALGKILNLLTFLEVEEGGPYYCRKTQKPTIDLGSNVAIAYFLNLQEIKLPKLTKLIEKHIEKRDFSSRIFENIYLNIYLISTFYRGSKKKSLIKYLKEEKSKIKNDFDLNLINNALVNLNSKNATQLKQKSSELDENEKEMLEKILLVAEKRFENLPKEIKKIAKREMKKTILGNPDKQMFLMPFYIKQALGENGKQFSDELIAEMGLANTFYWTAFIIYDDFWDEDEEANPQALPTANLYARHYCDYFSLLLPPETGFRDWFHQLMDKLDNANTWETIECRTKVKGSIFHIPEKIPNYENYDLKYQPASGHILGPVALFCLLKEKLNSSETKNLISYFKNYLIAMQINDDAHDWEEDMQRGHLSTVVVMILEDWLKKYPGLKTINLTRDKAKLEEIYWFTTIKRASKIALSYTEKSRNSLEKITLIENPAPLEKMITINEKVAREALESQEKSVKFLKEFD